MHTNKHGLLKLASLIFIIIVLIAGCNGAADTSIVQLEEQITAAKAGLEVELKQCRTGMESAQSNNAVLKQIL